MTPVRLPPLAFRTGRPKAWCPSLAGLAAGIP